MSAPRPKLAVFASFSGQGGVEKMLVNVCSQFVRLGYPVDLLLVKKQSEHLEALSSDVRVLHLGCRHTLSSIAPLVRYLRQERPIALLSAKERANRVALVAKRLANVPTRVVVRVGTTVSAALAKSSPLRRWAWYCRMRWFYPLADEIVAVSEGVATDMMRITGLPRGRIRVIPNPVIGPELFRQARDGVDHPWFGPKRPAVVLGAGRLTRQKGFDVLIRAFERVRRRLPAHLMILGEGEDRQMLSDLITELNLDGAVQLPGFVSNPSAYMAAAAVFVLSSRWEGSPNVLTEAMALGVPVVATDCPSGPREILRNGHLGPLVAPDNVEQLAHAITQVLHAPKPEAELQSAVDAYRVAHSSRHYLNLMLGTAQN